MGARPRLPIYLYTIITHMSSIWTPNGEHKVKRPSDRSEVDKQTYPNDTLASTEDENYSPEQGSEHLRELEDELRSLPTEDIITNHCYGLFQLAAIHLSSEPPNAKEASLAIDALGAIVDRLGERLGENTDSLREGLTQIRLAYVQITKVFSAGTAKPDSDND